MYTESMIINLNIKGIIIFKHHRWLNNYLRNNKKEK